jgi:hypothetical protein
MHVAMQLAYYMGFTTLLMIGVQHKPNKIHAHFWGDDRTAENPHYVIDQWFPGYAELVKGMGEHGVKVLNISEDTYVPASVLPRGDWRDYVSKDERILSGR